MAKGGDLLSCLKDVPAGGGLGAWGSPPPPPPAASAPSAAAGAPGKTAQSTKPIGTGRGRRKASAGALCA